MTLVISNRKKNDGTWECSFETAAQPQDSQKATTFIGHPSDRRTLSSIRKWKVSMPESASFQDDAVIWFGEGGFRTLTADEVFEYAQKQLHGFSCVQA